MFGQLKAGDRVGIKDGADFLHWSRTGVVTAMADPLVTGDAAAAIFQVLEDGEAEAVAMAAPLLVRLPAGGADYWSAQCFPTGGDRPGPVMYFLNSANITLFAREFGAAGLSDEKLHVHAPESATEEERAEILHAGAMLA